MQICKKFLSLVMVVVMLLSSSLAFGIGLKADAVTFNDINNSEVFIKQQSNNTCTLAAATMMLRRTAMAAGNTNWRNITEANLKTVAWYSGGLYYNFSYAGISVGHTTVSVANKKSTYISLLKQYPQGIVVYDRNVPHAVLLTDYDSTTDTFYCSDSGISLAGRVPITKSLISGNTQEARINNLSDYWYVKSPSVTITPASWKTSASKVNLGDDFYARIVNTDSNKALTNQNDNVILHSRTNEVDQVWRFTRNGDGTYDIVSKVNNKNLDVYDASAAPSANVQTWVWNGSAAQKWSVYGSQGKYILSAGCTDCVIDIQGGGYDNGTNIIVFTKHEGVNQLFSIEKISSPAKPSLAVSASGKNTVFSWSKDANASTFTLSVKKDGSVYKTVSTPGSSYTLNLPNGIYSATLTAKNEAYSVSSDAKSFTVNSSTDEKDWKYATSLPSGITSDKYDIEYRHTYKKTSKTSPGSDWVKGAVAKTEYVNKGDVYYSALPLATSNTRALVNYAYYHYCSKSKGDEVNYEQTSTFNHYDGVEKNNVYEFYSHADYADSRYTFYGLKYKSNDAYVYCNSSTTCDGSYGTHGNRSYYWYKMYAYQDKEAVNYYTYTKQEGWTSKKDSAAESYEVRYKVKNTCTSGHKYTSKVTKSATCSATGVKTYTCSVCGATKTETIAKTAHKYGAYKPACDFSNFPQDTQVRTCSVCKATQKATYTMKYSDSNSGVTTGSSYVKVVLDETELEDIGGVKFYLYDTSTKKYVRVEDDKIEKSFDEETWSNIYKIKGLKANTEYTVLTVLYGCWDWDGEPGEKMEDDIVSIKKSTVKTLSSDILGTTSSITATKTATSVTLNWNAVPGADGYRVYRKTSSGWLTLGHTTRLTYTENSLKANTKYTYAVKAYVLDGATKVFAPKYKTLDVTTSKATLGTTSKITATKTTSSVTLKWNKVTGATGYRVYQKTASGWKTLANTTKLTYTVKSLKTGTKYTFAIRAYVTKSGKMTLAPKYKTLDVTTTSSSAKPAQVKNLKATPTATTVKLTWSKVSGVKGYYVFSYNSKTKKYTSLGKTTGTSYTVKNRKANTAYQYAVQAYKVSGGKNVFGKVSSVVKVTTLLATPTVKISSTKGKANLTWNNIAGESGYAIYMATSKNGKYTHLANYKANSTKATKSKLTSGKTYYFKIRAYKTVNGAKTYGGYSAVKSVKIK